MIPLFIGLTLVNLIALATAAALGYAGKAGYAVGPWHVLAGALAALVCCAVHCVVFTYFAATAKWVLHAIEVKRLDPTLALPTRSFKAQAFPAAMLAMAATFVAAVMGAGADNYRGAWSTWHHAGAVAAVVVNVIVAAVEYRAISRNGRLIDEVLARVAAAGT
jgi:integral membrane sensor domain MASE1